MSENELFLVADIGGTNARFAVVDGQTGDWLGHWQTKVASHPGIAEVIEKAQLHLLGSNTVAAVCLAVGAPADSEQIRFTNSPWNFSKQQLQDRFNWPQLLVINDFTAAAYGVLALPVRRHQVIGQVVQDSYCKPSAVIGPGTGLGAAGLYPHDGSWVVVSTEAGHVRWAAGSRQQFELLCALQQGDFESSVQREDILSGPGLRTLYQAMAKLRGVPGTEKTPAEITQQALSGADPLSTEVLSLFCGLLGQVVADIAVDLGVRGNIFMAGGILPKIADFFLTSSFRHQFENHSQYQSYFQTINTFLVTEDKLGLIGAYSALLKDMGHSILLDDSFRVIAQHSKSTI